MPSKDYYKVLQVDPEAEPEVIAAAYRRLSLKYHPDTNKAPDATARMQEINEAYEVLSEPAKRARYDAERSALTSRLAPEDRGTWREKAGAERWGEEKKRSESWKAEEERRRAEYERHQREWEEKVRRRAAEAAERAIHAFRSAPRGARVVKAFSREPVYCDRNFTQEQTVPGGWWIDLGFEWIARDVVALEATWPALMVAVTVDGQVVDNPRQQPKGPDEAILNCADKTRFVVVMADALCIPPLPLGDHTVIWTVGFARDVDDGWNAYPQGTELVVTSLLHVVKAV